MIEISNCCNAPFGYPGWPDCDICSQCGEHSDLEICEDVGDSQYKDKKLQINLRKHFKEIK